MRQSALENLYYQAMITDWPICDWPIVSLLYELSTDKNFPEDYNFSRDKDGVVRLIETFQP